MPGRDPRSLDPAERRRGFTLVEVVVALLIFGLTFAVLARIVQTGVLPVGARRDHDHGDPARALAARADRGRRAGRAPASSRATPAAAFAGASSCVRPSSRPPTEDDPRRIRSCCLSGRGDGRLGRGRARAGADAHHACASRARRSRHDAAASSPTAAGFTLVEILVAITLLGLLMAALFGGVQLGVRAWEASEARLDDSSRLPACRASCASAWRRPICSKRSCGAEDARSARVRGRTRSPELRHPDARASRRRLPAHGPGARRRPRRGRRTSPLSWWPAELGDASRRPGRPAQPGAPGRGRRAAPRLLRLARARSGAGLVTRSGSSRSLPAAGPRAAALSRSGRRAAGPT